MAIVEYSDIGTTGCSTWAGGCGYWSDTTSSTTYTYTVTGTTWIPYTYYRQNEWGNWVQHIPQYQEQVEIAQYQPPPLTEEQRRRLEEDSRRLLEEQQRQKADQEVARAVAKERGVELLKDILGAEDFASYQANGYVDIQSAKDPNKRYRIRANRMIGIVKLEDGRWVEKPLSLCIHPESHWQYVVGDLVATHVLLAKYDEQTLETVANKHQRAA